jgi:hypothetical protein
MRSLTLVLAGLASSLPLTAEETDASSFPGLKVINVAGSDSPQGTRISYDPALAQVINKPLKASAADSGEPEITRLLAATRVDREGQAKYTIDFDPGPSADPTFIISDEKSGERVGSIGADSLTVPGNGFIYALGRSNNLHLERQKFAIREGKLVEIQQPFSYVGLDSKANVPLTLTANKGTGDVIAKIPKGDALQVVLRDGEYLLIKTQFGLIGWWKMKTDVTPDTTEIEGIYYAGD